MPASSAKTSLVVLFNHRFDRNIPLIREMYSSRFPSMVQLMPYYQGQDADVCSVFGNSFQFYNYIVQSRERIRALPGDYILIIGDDLLLNPAFNEDNTASLLGLESGDDFYLDGFVDVSLPECWRGTQEAHNFSTTPPGVDAKSVNGNIPSYEEARAILKSRGLMAHDTLSRVRMFFPSWQLSKGLYFNWKVLKARGWHIRNWLKYKLRRYAYSYPVVFGYSDIICIPRKRFDDFCRVLSVFSAWNMFVELAIPTALQLLPDARIRTLADVRFKSGNVWYPQSTEHFDSMNRLIDDLLQSSSDAQQLADNFPQEYMYLHPVKLSRYAGKAT